MRAAIYVRVSSEEQAKKGYSLLDQVDVCTKKAKELGATNILVFKEEGVPGSLLNRPELDKLRELMRNREIDLVVCYDPDRLSRELAYQLIITDEADKNGVRIEFVNFEWKNTPDGKLFYAIRGAISEFEKAKIRDRTSSGRLRKAKEGKLPSYFQNYGYDYDQENATLIPNSHESVIVQKMFNWFVNDNIGMNGIARKLNELGVPTKKRKGQWHRQVVRQILMNPVYIGQLRYNTHDCTDYGLNKYKSKEERVKIKPKPEEEWVIVPVPALIDEELFTAAQEKLAQSRRLWAGNKKNFKQYLLSGLVRCGDCFNTMTGVYQNCWDTKYRFYTCRKNQAGNNPGCRPAKRIRADLLENIIWGKIREWLSNPDLLADELAATREQSVNIENELEYVEQQLRQSKKGREDILKLVAENVITLDEAKKNLDALADKISALEGRKKELNRTLNVVRLSDNDRVKLKRLAEEHLNNLDDYDFETKQKLVRILIKQVTVNGSRPDFEITIEALVVPGAAIGVESNGFNAR